MDDVLITWFNFYCKLIIGQGVFVTLEHLSVIWQAGCHIHGSKHLTSHAFKESSTSALEHSVTCEHSSVNILVCHIRVFLSCEFIPVITSENLIQNVTSCMTWCVVASYRQTIILKLITVRN